MEQDRPDSPAMLARRLLLAADAVSLATLEPGGHPFVSLARIATAPDGSPLLLLSGLARHTRNLAADSRASLLIRAPAGGGDPLADTRLTVLGRVERDDSEAARSGYLTRHADAASYASFKDFAFYRMTVESAYQVAGFGRIDPIPREALIQVPSTPAVAGKS